MLVPRNTCYLHGLIRNRSGHYRSHSKGKGWILLDDGQSSHEWFDWSAAVVKELLAPISIKRSFNQGLQRWTQSSLKTWSLGKQLRLLPTGNVMMIQLEKL
ncbi:hypothetical protein CDAR_477381 [Caerostris darwini]|uniref:Uncharacterized protein n=1 Tax=Caerostris darwini TaxID=1538125 RepID=A0AAV4TQ00_9ARAC|nr:hypothetical protein CDAR_477381 [Caerostris darwini]